MGRWVRGVVGCVGLSLLAQGGAGAADASVSVRDNEFVPKTVVVEAGTTVVWTQVGDNPHTVTADDGSFDSHPACPPVCMERGESFRRGFNTAGTFRYYCKIHGRPGGVGMSGVVEVRAASATTTPTTSAAAPARQSTATTAGAAAVTTSTSPGRGAGGPFPGAPTAAPATSNTAAETSGTQDGAVPPVATPAGVPTPATGPPPWAGAGVGLLLAALAAATLARLVRTSG